MTPSDLATQAAKRVNIIAHNESLSDSELADCISNLNSILSMYSMESLMADNGIVLPLAPDDAHTGMDDQIEFALIDILAVRLASVYQLPIGNQIALDARRAERALKAWNVKPIYSKADRTLMARSSPCNLT